MFIQIDQARFLQRFYVRILVYNPDFRLILDLFYQDQFYDRLGRSKNYSPYHTLDSRFKVQKNLN